jgi:CHAT domain-containing protein
LVSLGSCFGSSITINRSSGPQGVAPAFLEAGARCVLASAFSVDDEASAIFFQRFAHLALATDGPRLDLPTAVQRARMWLRQYRAPDGSRPYASPALWSTFILLGWPE